MANSAISNGGPSGPEFIFARFKVGILNLDDVEQTIRADVDCYFYFMPVEKISLEADPHVRFENIEKPAWTPHWDFANEFEEVLCTEESYWLDTQTGLVFGRVNWIPSIQERFDHHAFPFDRQILDVQTMVNNCQILPWELTSPSDHPPEVSMDNPKFLAQAVLNAVADAWDLIDLITHSLNDPVNKSAIIHFQIFMEREVDYYYWNIIMIFFIIIGLKVVLVAYPYTEARFNFAMTLALTTVAFMFVTTTMKPKTSYLTFLDKYMLLGLVLLATRFIMDMVILLVFEEVLPFGNEGVRASCTSENELFSGVTPCSVDITMTAILFGVWVSAAGYITLCACCFPHWVRPKWDALNTRITASSATEKEKVGITKWLHDDKVISNIDLTDAVDYPRSRANMASGGARGDKEHMVADVKDHPN